MSIQIKNESRLIMEKTQILFNEINEAYKEGLITSKKDLIQELFSLYNDYFELMKNPQLQRTELLKGSVIDSDEYNDMLYGIYQDFTIFYEEMKIITNVLNIDMHLHTTETEMLRELSREVLDRLKDLEIYNGVQDNKNKYFARDHFLNSDKVDYDLLRAKPLLINNGNLTLPIKSIENVAKDAEVKIALGGKSKNNIAIGSESNGFPGNNTEVVSVRDDSLLERGYTSSFIGNGNSRSNYGVILDEESDSWFEFEKVELKNEDLKRRLKNLGTEYAVDESHKVKWVEAPENNILKLNIQIALSQEELINNIDISMYTPPQIDAQQAIVKNIIIHNENGQSISVVDYKSENETTYYFNPTKAKIINIYFEQRNPYFTNIGHVFFQERIATNNYGKYVLEEVKKINNAGKRVKGPAFTLSEMGAEVIQTNHSTELDYPYVASGSSTNSISISNRLERITREIENEFTDVGIESLEAKRWCIGIKNIKINKVEFEDYGELITKPFYFDTPLEKISLNIGEGLSEVKNWFEYYVSIDNAVSWHPITPIEHVESGYPKIYTIRTISEGESSIDDQFGYLETTHPVYSMRFKVVGRKDLIKEFSSGNSYEDQMTPILHNFKVNASLSNELEMQDDSYITSEKVIEILPEVPDEKQEVLDYVSLNDKCIEEWIGEGDYYIRGTVSMNNPIERIEFYERGVLEKSIVLYSPSNIVFTHNYSFKVNKSYFPINSLQAHQSLVVYAYDTTGRRIKVEHKLKLIKCEIDPPPVPGFTAYIQNKRPICDNEFPELFFIINSTGEKIIKVELTLNGRLIRTFTTNSKGPIYLSHKMTSKLTNSTQNYFKLTAYDENGGVAIDRYYPEIISCIGPPESDLGYNIGLPPEICDCEDIELNGHITTRSPIKKMTILVNGKVYNPSDYTLSAMNKCTESVQPYVARRSEIVVELKETKFEDCSPCEKRRLKRLEKELIQIERLIDNRNEESEEFELFSTNYQSDRFDYDINQLIPGWIIQEIKMKGNGNIRFDIRLEEESGKQTEISLLTTIVECIISDCMDLASIKVSYYDFAAEEIKTNFIGKRDLPFFSLDNGLGEKVKVGWNKSQKSIYFHMIQSINGPGFIITELEATYKDKNGTLYSERFSHIVEKTGEVYQGETLFDLKNQTAVLKEIKEGNFSNTAIISKKESTLSLRFRDKIHNEFCLFGDSPRDDSEKIYQNKEICSSSHYGMVQFMTESNSEIKTFVFELKKNNKFYFFDGANKIDFSIGYSEVSKGVTVIFDNPSSEKRTYLLTLATFSSHQYDQLAQYEELIREHVGETSYNKGLQGDKINEKSQISWIQDGIIDQTVAVWSKNKDSIVIYEDKSSFLDIIKQCNVSTDFDKDNQSNDSSIIIKEEKPIDDSDDIGCVYKIFKELENPDYDIEEEDLIRNNKGKDYLDIKIPFSVTAEKGIESIRYKIYVNDEEKIEGAIDIPPEENNYLFFIVNVSRGILKPGDKVRIEVYAKEKYSIIEEVEHKEFYVRNCLVIESSLYDSDNQLAEDNKLKICIQNNTYVKGFVENTTLIKSFFIRREEDEEIVYQSPDNINKAKTQFDFMVGKQEAQNLNKERYEIVIELQTGERSTIRFVAEYTKCKPEPGDLEEPTQVPPFNVEGFCGSNVTASMTGNSGDEFLTKRIVHSMTNSDGTPMPNGTYRFTVKTDVYGAADSFDAYYNGMNIASSRGNYVNKQNFIFDITLTDDSPRELSIVMIRGSGGSAWEYQVSCEVLGDEPKPGAPTDDGSQSSHQHDSFCGAEVDSQQISGNGENEYTKRITHPLVDSNGKLFEDGKYRLEFTITAWNQPDTFDLYHEGRNILTSGGEFSGTKTFGVDLELNSNSKREVLVVMFKTQETSIWKYQINCSKL